MSRERENNFLEDVVNGSVFPIAWRWYKNLRMTLEHGQWLSSVNAEFIEKLTSIISLLSSSLLVIYWKKGFVKDAIEKLFYPSHLSKAWTIFSYYSGM